jgi:hypothetical protein
MGVRQSGAGGWGGDVGDDDVLSCAVEDWVVLDQLDGREGATEGDVILGQMLYHCTTPTTVALTIDYGPWIYTQSILDTLAKYSVHATFYVTDNNGSPSAPAPVLPPDPSPVTETKAPVTTRRPTTTKNVRLMLKSFGKHGMFFGILPYVLSSIVVDMRRQFTHIKRRIMAISKNIATKRIFGYYLREYAS